MISNYDRDYNQWILQTVQQLKEKKYDMVDWDNLIEEIEDMGKRERRAIESLLTRLLEHLLKLKYWQEEKSLSANHWAAEIVNFRALIQKRLNDSPSLNSTIQSIYDEVYPTAKKSVSKLFLLPEDAEISLENALDDEWFPID